MKFQFSIARLLLAITGFAFVLGIMKPLKLAGNPLVLISAAAVAIISLIAKRSELCIKGTIAIVLQIINVTLCLAWSYCRGPLDAPARWEMQYKSLSNVIEWLLCIFLFPLGYLGVDNEVLLPILIVLNCYLWAKCIGWTVDLFKKDAPKTSLD
jgi:hypothetical protein